MAVSRARRTASQPACGRGGYHETVRQRASRAPRATRIPGARGGLGRRKGPRHPAHFQGKAARANDLRGGSDSAASDRRDPGATPVRAAAQFLGGTDPVAHLAVLLAAPEALNWAGREGGCHSSVSAHSAHSAQSVWKNSCGSASKKRRQRPQRRSGGLSDPSGVPDDDIRPSTSGLTRPIHVERAAPNRRIHPGILKTHATDPLFG